MAWLGVVTNASPKTRVTLAPYDILGIVGVGFILVAYLALQMEKMDPKSVLYSTLNALGAALVLISLYFDFNLSAALVEGFWLCISLYGLCKALALSRGP